MSLDRTYSSLRAVHDFGSTALGNGWSFDFDYEVYKRSSTNIFFKTPTSEIYELVLDTPSNTFRPVGNPTLFKIVSVGATYELTYSDDRFIKFEAASDGVTLPVHRPTIVRDRGGYQRTITRDANGKISGLTDNLGRSFTYTWTGEVLTQVGAPGGINVSYGYNYAVAGDISTRRLTTVAISNGTTTETTTYHYEDPNYPYNLTGTTDARGVRYKTAVYDALGRAIESGTVGSNDKTTFSYTVGSTTTTNALGKQTKYNYTSVNGIRRLSGVDGVASTNCPASAKSITYATDGGILETTDEEGRKTRYVRDGGGQPTSITRGYGTPQAVTTTYTYHPTLRQPTQMVEPGKTTNYVWDAVTGRLTSMSEVDTTTGTVPYSSNGQTRTTSYTYSGTAGLLASVDGSLAGTGDTVAYTYDATGYVNTVTNQVGHVTTINTKNGRGQPTQVTDSNGVVTNLTYDLQGRLLTVTVNPGAGQAVTAMTYDAIGQITRLTPPNGAYFDYTYNNARRLTTVTALDAQKIEYTYDLMGNRTSTTIKDASNVARFTETQTFDELGRLLRNIGANTQTTTFAYEKNDNLKSVTDPRSGIYSYAYDSLNRLIRETDQQSAQVNYTLDGQDNITTYADPRNLQTTYIRNGFGEIKRQTSPDSGNTDYVRDLRGLITQKTDARGVITNMTYDNAGRMLTRTFPAATAENVTLTYDAITPTTNKGRGRLTGLTHEGGSVARQYDVRGNLTRDARTITASGATARTVDYVYNTADQVTQITYPSGRQVLFTRDTMGRITAVTTKKSAADPLVNIATSITYQPISRLVKNFTYGNALTQENTYTNDYEVGQCQVKDGATVTLGRLHARTDALNLTGITDQVTTANNQTFAYSAANRLTSASGPYGAQSWVFDGVGNRTSQTLAGVTSTLTYPATSNRVSSVNSTPVRNLTYDNAGNTLTDSRSGGPFTFTYNNANRLKTVTAASTLRGTYTYM